MKRIIIFGTLHGLTPESELNEVLNKYRPEHLLVEIAQEDIDSGAMEAYPSEMIFAYNWAVTNNVNVSGFDCKMNVFQEGKMQLDNELVMEEQNDVMNGFTWKDMNKDDNMKLLETPSENELVDKKKERMREKKMLENIESKLVAGPVALIITGCGHLKFFEENIKGAIFPFR